MKHFTRQPLLSTEPIFAYSLACTGGDPLVARAKAPSEMFADYGEFTAGEINSSAICRTLYRILRCADGPNFLILQSATEHPPSDATLELCVDASERRWTISRVIV